MPNRRCLDCGRLAPRSPCGDCGRRRKAIRNAHAPAAKAVVEAHRATAGDICPGWNRPAHPAVDLTAEHSTPITRGGVPDAVLCRGCNSAKGRR